MTLICVSRNIFMDMAFLTPLRQAATTVHSKIHSKALDKVFVPLSRGPLFVECVRGLT